MVIGNYESSTHPEILTKGKESFTYKIQHKSLRFLYESPSIRPFLNQKSSKNLCNYAIHNMQAF